MQLKLLMDILEKLAPRELAEEWDNPGLLVEPESKEITKVLVALDCTIAVAEEAKEVGAQLVLTHHPLFYKPVRRMHHSDPETAAAYSLVRNGIGLFAAHTNLDSALYGVNDALAAAVGLLDVRGLLAPEAPLSEQTQSLGRIGILERSLSIQEFSKIVEKALSTTVLVGGEIMNPIRRVAVVGGAGGSMLQASVEAKADLLLTGELKHSETLSAKVYGIGVMVAGHYETESIVLAPWIEGLQRAFQEIQCNVEFVRAKAEHAALVSI